MIFGNRHLTHEELKAWREDLRKWKPFFPLFPRMLTAGLNKGRWVWLQEVEQRFFEGEGGIYAEYKLKGDHE